MVILIVLAVAVPDDVELPVEILAVVSFVLAFLQWVLSSMTRVSLWRFVPCPQKKTTNLNLIISKVTQVLIMVCLALAYLTAFKSKFAELDLMQTILIYRAFNKLYHYPLNATIESLVLLQDPTPTSLALAAFGLNRLHILARKVQFMMVSYATAVKNKK